MGTLEERRNGDRRLHARGGRRPEDRPGYTPLVFVVTRDAVHRDFWEGRLLELRFAVVPCDGFGPALEALHGLRPDVILAAGRDVPMLRDRLPSGRRGAAIPIVELAGATASTDLVIREIREALRTREMTDR
jgi:hypothetical protein